MYKDDLNDQQNDVNLENIKINSYFCRKNIYEKDHYPLSTCSNDRERIWRNAFLHREGHPFVSSFGTIGQY